MDTIFQSQIIITKILKQVKDPKVKEKAIKKTLEALYDQGRAEGHDKMCTFSIHVFDLFNEMMKRGWDFNTHFNTDHLDKNGNLARDYERYLNEYEIHEFTKTVDGKLTRRVHVWMSKKTLMCVAVSNMIEHTGYIRTVRDLLDENFRTT